MSRITILGGGRWGTALGLHLSKKGFELMFFDRNPTVVESLKKVRTHTGDWSLLKSQKRPAY